MFKVERICYDCGKKDKEGTERQMKKFLFGEGSAH